MTEAPGPGEKAKALRHELRRALDRVPGADRRSRLESRDSEQDIGREWRSESEARRAGIVDVCLAAGARAGEALRALSEGVKVLAPATDAGKAIDRVRYALYAIEKEIVGMLPRARQWRLCVLITESACRHRDWIDVASEAVAGGADCLQLREKDLTDRELTSRARRLVDICGQRADVIINDRCDVALASGAAGVHLGADDLGPSDARRVLGGSALIGVTCRDVEQAAAAKEASADYVGIGPLFESATKNAGEAKGAGAFASIARDPRVASMPHLAISGITPERVPALLDAGVRGIAVCSAVCGSPEPREACRELISTMERQIHPELPEATPCQ